MAKYYPYQALTAESLNENFSELKEHVERIENLLVKIYKEKEIKGSDLIFDSSVNILYDKNNRNKSGRYGILRNSCQK
jgi:hypothetical protein